MQTFEKLCEKNTIDIGTYLKLLIEATGRLRDEKSIVRKRAISLVGRIIGMYIGTRNIPKRCFCYEIKSEKTRNLIEVKTTNVKTTNDKTVKDKDKPIKDERLKDKTNKNYHPLRRRPMIETIIKDHPKCQKGEYFVAVTYPDKGITKFGCTKDPYSYLKYY